MPNGLGPTLCKSSASAVQCSGSRWNANIPILQMHRNCRLQLWEKLVVEK
jgi:hypothetical protein